jgi:Phospholipase_D-nuclease N-terminal
LRRQEMDSAETNVTAEGPSSTEPAEMMVPDSPRSKKQWKDLSSGRKRRIAIQGMIQVALAAWALWDIRHRPADRIKGSKRLWTLAAFVQPVGPVAYFLFGRKK